MPGNPGLAKAGSLPALSWDHERAPSVALCGTGYPRDLDTPKPGRAVHPPGSWAIPRGWPSLAVLVRECQSGRGWEGERREGNAFPRFHRPLGLRGEAGTDQGALGATAPGTAMAMGRLWQGWATRDLLDPRRWQDWPGRRRGGTAGGDGTVGVTARGPLCLPQRPTTGWWPSRPRRAHAGVCLACPPAVGCGCSSLWLVAPAHLDLPLPPPRPHTHPKKP